MKTLSMLVVGLLLGAVANAAAVAADASAVEIITVTAKRPGASDTTSSAPPKAPVVIAAPLPTDMPEMQIDSHLTPIDVASVPSVAHAAL